VGVTSSIKSRGVVRPLGTFTLIDSYKEGQSEFYVP
jgi:hypothetical protein